MSLLEYSTSGNKLKVNKVEDLYGNKYKLSTEFQLGNLRYVYELEYVPNEGIKDILNDERVIKRHRSKDNFKYFERLINMMQTDLNSKDMKSMLEKNTRESDTDIKVYYDTEDKNVEYVMIKNHDLDNQDFNKMVNDMSRYNIRVSYNRKNERAPLNFKLSTSFAYISDDQMSDMTKVLMKYGIDLENYRVVEPHKEDGEHTYFTYD